MDWNKRSRDRVNQAMPVVHNAPHFDA
jgi:hypothetical protein